MHMYLWFTISRNTYSRLIEPCLYNQMKKGKQKQDTKNYPLPSLGPVENSVAERVEKFRESSKKGIDVLLTA